MPSKRDVLDSLTTHELRSLVDAYDLDAPDRRRKDALVDTVAEGIDLWKAACVKGVIDVTDFNATATRRPRSRRTRRPRTRRSDDGLFNG